MVRTIWDVAAEIGVAPETVFDLGRRLYGVGWDGSWVDTEGKEQMIDMLNREDA